MPPGEEDDAQFAKDVRVGDVEVVLECGDGYEAAKVLLHILLSGIYSALSHLKTQLRGGVVDEAPERWVGTVSSLLLAHAAALLAISISALRL